MQQQNRTEIVQDITNAVKLEQELRLIHEQHGVAVLDVYSSEWGLSKALSETFRRLQMDASDQAYLRFLSVECNSILESIDQTEEHHQHMKTDDKVKFRESLAPFWKDILESRRGKSKSYFVFFKEGRKRTSIEGINTPKIINYVIELCRSQKPAKECTESKPLLDFWGRYFGEGESEVFWESFMRAILEHVGTARPLSAKEESTLAEVIGVDGDKVSVSALDKWTAGQAIETAFINVFPFLSKSEETPADSGKRKASGDQPADDTALTGSFVNVLSSHCDARTEWKPEIWHRVLAIQPDGSGNSRFVLMSCEEAEKDAEDALALVADLPTVEAYLSGCNVAAENIHIMCHAAAEKYPSGSIAYAKLAQLLISCNGDKLEELTGVRQELADELAGGTLLKNYPTLAYTVICHCTSEVTDAKPFYYCCDEAGQVNQIENAKEGGQVVLPPLSRLSSSGETEAAFKVEICGIPNVIQLEETGENGVFTVLTPWFTKFNVKEASDNHLVLEFVENVGDEQFRQVLEPYAKRICEDEDKLSASADIIALYERSLGLGHELSLPSVATQNNFGGSGAPPSASSVGRMRSTSGVEAPKGEHAEGAPGGSASRLHEGSTSQHSRSAVENGAGGEGDVEVEEGQVTEPPIAQDTVAAEDAVADGGANADEEGAAQEVANEEYADEQFGDEQSCEAGKPSDTEDANEKTSEAAKEEDAEEIGSKQASEAAKDPDTGDIEGNEASGAAKEAETEEIGSKQISETAKEADTEEIDSEWTSEARKPSDTEDANEKTSEAAKDPDNDDTESKQTSEAAKVDAEEIGSDQASEAMKRSGTEGASERTSEAAKDPDTEDTESKQTSEAAKVDAEEIGSDQASEAMKRSGTEDISGRGSEGSRD
ncbi:hypothetical protein, conserved [Trypanosoma brucei brucei TREU927]|uniref:Uncharacterized protein n=1 Tax=Trypanosoma brucei brucei (strain 927/4 GUTat10.1) TaxID=185431 RepID=Q383Y9_TRYB2|nr:hypothetical protein, conserved [Trypanosoma brucei brucei TREU927]EAN79892.1 hypothetical protein, conserved [Trypanosoma brucei brucei TREU927]